MNTNANTEALLDEYDAIADQLNELDRQATLLRERMREIWRAL